MARLESLLLLLILFVQPNCLGQRIDLNNQFGTRYVSFNESVDAGVIGSKYIMDQFLPSKVSCFEGLAPPIRYNAYADQMEFKIDGALYNVNKMDNCEITLLNKTYRTVNYTDDNKAVYGYLIVLSAEGKFRLYKREKIVLIPEYKATTSYQESRPATYKVDKEKFFVEVNGEIKNMPSKKKELMELITGNTETIESFLKKNKISFGDENDLIQLIKFLNSI